MEQTKEKVNVKISGLENLISIFKFSIRAFVVLIISISKHLISMRYFYNIRYGWEEEREKVGAGGVKEMLL